MKRYGKTNMKGLRGERLGGEFQKEIYAVINGRIRFDNPDMSPVISVPDLKSAKVFISVFDTNKRREENTFEIIKENAGLIRRELSKVMRVRTVPELRIKKDESMQYGEKIDKILLGLEKDEK